MRMKGRLFALRAGFTALWLILVALVVSRIRWTPGVIFFASATILLCSHVLYGGYFLLARESRLNAALLVCMGGIYAGLIGLCRSSASAYAWYAWVIVIFICAMPFHVLYRKALSHLYLREFCNYKIFVEITGIIMCVGGMLALAVVPETLLGAITFFGIIKFNHTIFIKKQLYRIRYDNPAYAEMPLVTIVVIAYNEERFVGELLAALQKQDYPHYEVILVDDHSRDGTVRVAESFCKSLPLRIVQKEVRGISRSRNFGATLANGEIIVFLDADVIVAPDFIRANLAQFREMGCSVAGVDFIARTTSALDNRIVAFYRRWLQTVQYFNPRGIGISLFVTRELHRKVLFDETIVMSEDFDYIKRAHALGRFRILTRRPSKVSWRRFERENRFVLIGKYLFFEWYRQHIGEIRKSLLSYEFGNTSSSAQ